MGGRAGAIRRRGWLGMAVLVSVALLAAACGGGGDDAGAVPSPTGKDGKRLPLPEDLCTLLTEKEIEEATDMEVGEARSAPPQCAWVAPDGKKLVASILVQRGTQAVIDFDDLVHTRDSEEAKGVKGADRVSFNPPFFTLAALKEPDTHAMVQVPGLKGESNSKIKKVAQELLETLLTRI